MQRVRVQLSFHTFRYGDVFTIDETHPHWAEPLEQGWVRPVDHEVTVPATGWRPNLVFARPSSTFVPGQPETL